MKKLAFLFALLFFCFNHSTFSQETTFREGSFWEVDRCDACETCSSGRGDRITERKEVAAFCDGKDIGAWTITHTTICPSRRYTSTHFKEYYIVSSTFKRYKSEYAAMEAIRQIAMQLCSGGTVQEGYITKEAAREARKKKEDERAKRHAQLLEDYKSGKIIPDTSHWRNDIPASTLTAEEIVNYDWELQERGAFGIIVQTKKVSFKSDGTYSAEIYEALTSPKKEEGTWTLLEDQTVEIIHAARISKLSQRVTVYIEELSFWEGFGRFGASSSYGSNTVYTANRITKGDNAPVYDGLEGEWSLQVKTRSRKKPIEMAFKLNKDGTEIYGEYLSAKRGSLEICQKADIRGNLEDGQFNLEIEYTGDCCSGVKLKLEGEMIRQDQFFATFTILEETQECGRNMQHARVTGLKGRHAFKKSTTDRTKLKKRSSSYSRSHRAGAGTGLINGTFETLDDWSVNAGDAKIIEEVVALRPHKKKKAVVLKSKAFKIPAKTRYLRFGIDKSKVKSGHLKVVVTDLATGERKEVYKDEMRLSLQEVNQAVENFRLSKLTTKKEAQPRKMEASKVDISHYRGKEVEIAFVYKASGLSKPMLFLDDISMR